MITLEGLEKTYRKAGQGPICALRGLSLRVTTGEFVAILGPSGSGKSTLMNMIGLLDRPDSGSYRLEDRDMLELHDDELAALRNRKLGFVFQAFHLLPRATALENVMLPLLYTREKHPEARARAALEAVGLADRARHLSHELSGGQQQRVAVARALVNEPGIVLADEPTGNLDEEAEAGILDLLESIHGAGRTVIFITHNHELARRAGRLIVIRDGAIASDSRPEPVAGRME